jgi:hypothetical protein
MSAAERQRPREGELVLDHVSHFVPDLDAAADALAALGFAVTPRSDQRTRDGPAGAANRCVMLEAGYLELLSPTLDTPTAQRMRAAMARHAGVHLACFGTPAAAEEHERLAAHGFAPQPLVQLSRDAGGGRTARFSVVRTAPEAMPEGRIQYVEQHTPEHLWRPEHLAHANGVLGLAALYVVVQEPAAAAAARWARFLGALPRREGEFAAIDTSRGRVLLGPRAACEALLGAVPEPPALAGYVLACRDAREFSERCRAGGLSVTRAGGYQRVALPGTLGGAWLLGGAPQGL